MRFLDKPIHSVTADDIRDLVYNRRLPESRTMDYKQELPSDKDNKKMEFLKDVAALANSSGGVLVYGVSEEKDENDQNTGFPEGIVDLIGFQPDQDIRRLDQIIMDGIQPRLKVEFEPIEVDGKWVLLLAVPRSLMAPHIIWFNKSGKFYARGNAGNFQMDVHQIREAFLQADSWEKQADNFRRMRLMDLQAGKVRMHPNVEEGLFIHIVPLGAPQLGVNYKSHEDSLMGLKPMYVGGSVNCGFNSDGFFVTYNGPSFYAQYFRNGSVECFSDGMFHSFMGPNTTIAGDALERYVVKRLVDYIRYAPSLGISPPYGVYLSLFGLQGVELIGVNPTPQEPWNKPFGKFEDSELLLPNVTIEEIGDDLEATISTALRPVFDVLWQAAGRPESPHYKNGIWMLQLGRND